MRVCAVIPCYNEEKMIGGLVYDAKQFVDRVVVVDNGSDDRTSECAWKSGAMVVQYRDRQGAGASTGFGISMALANMNPEIVVTLDGDGQHNPNNILAVVRPIYDGEADVVIGSRFLKCYKLPKYRKFGIDVITWLFNVGNNQKITDAQSCFRAFSCDALKAIMPIEEQGFSFSVEVLVKARAKGLMISEVPIDCIYHDDSSLNSTINPIKHGLTVALDTVKWRIRER